MRHLFKKCFTVKLGGGELLDNLERGPLAMARGGAGQERADRINRLAVAPNNPADVALAQLHAEDRHFSRWDLGKHHLIGKLDKLANDELEELLHESECMRPSRFVTPSVALLVSVSRLEDRSVLPDRADFFPVRPKQPIPIIGAASDEVAVLLNQQAILVFARGDDPDVVARKKVALFPIRRVHDVNGAGRCPLGTDEINQLAVSGELHRLERRQHMVLIAFASRQRSNIVGSLPSTRTCQSSVGSISSDPVAIFLPSIFLTNTTHLRSGASTGSESRPPAVSAVVVPALSVNWILPSLTETVWAKARIETIRQPVMRNSRFMWL